MSDGGGTRGLPRDRGDSGGQRTLGVNRAAPEEALALASHRDEPRHGVHVPEEQHLTRAAAPEADDVADLVALGGKAHATQPGDQPLAELALLRRGAGDRHHLLQQLDAGLGDGLGLGAHGTDHAGTASSAPTRSTYSMMRPGMSTPVVSMLLRNSMV